MAASKLRFFSSGLALFSMFFGAGNVIFPLIIGQTVGDSLFYALLGLIITAVLVPFSGFLSITLFEGDYFKFFSRLGKWPSLFIISVILCLIGPFGGIPRCITLTFATMKIYVSNIKLMAFSFCACTLLFLCCWKRHRIIDLLGLFLTPLLLLFLVVIIVKALFFSALEPGSAYTKGAALFYGIKEGYNTMDLLAAIFFSSIICSRFKKEGISDPKLIVKRAFNISLFGAVLLAGVYVGFSYAAARFRSDLAYIPQDQLLGALGQVILGPKAGFVVSMVVLLSCLTTAIALSVVSAEFLKNVIFRNKISYTQSLIMILAVSLMVSSLQFSGIVRFLSPILQILYPALLIFSFFNLFYQYFKLKQVRSQG